MPSRTSERHACPDWDYLRIGPGDVEIEMCLCEGPLMGGAACVCGDYRRNHERGVGAVEASEHAPSCLVFRLAVPAP